METENIWVTEEFRGEPEDLRNFCVDLFRTIRSLAEKHKIQIIGGEAETGEILADDILNKFSGLTSRTA